MASAHHLNFSNGQVQRACSREVVPKDYGPGRPPKLSESHVDWLEESIRSWRQGRLLKILEIHIYLFTHWNCSEDII